jgi:hypothetical protein
LPCVHASTESDAAETSAPRQAQIFHGMPMSTSAENAQGGQFFLCGLFIESCGTLHGSLHKMQSLP